MRRLLAAATLLILLLSNFPVGGNAVRAQEASSSTEPASGAVVCEPGLYGQPPAGCQPLGPSARVAALAETGIPWPIRPLPAFTPDAGLNSIPYLYFRVTENGAPLYASLGDLISNSPSGQALAPGTLYVSYSARVETESGVAYQLDSGLWIRGEGSRISVPVFQGLQFSSTPGNSFGWVMGEVRSRTAPGFNSPETGRTWYRYQVVQIYDIQPADSIDWLLVGPDEWVDYRQVARVDPRRSAPDGVPAERWIEVNLDEQTLAVYQENRLAFATVIASGVEPFWTQPGVFQIYEKKDTENMSGSTAADRSDYYYLEDVPWTMYYDLKRALHGAYWHNAFGYPRSHGCVNLSIGDSHWLYDWAAVGDYVYVYDPAGRTPTDPALFGSGAP